MSSLSLQSFEGLLATPEPPELGPGPRAGVQPEAALRQAFDQLLLAVKLPADGEELVFALILLWHDHLDASHQIAQRIATSSGAFVHGIMHRREPDYGNAQYWFNRVGRHPVFPEIAERVGAISELKSVPDLRGELLPKGKWDPKAMIAACEQTGHPGTGKERKRLLRQVQRAETEALLNWLIQQPEH
jgi:hypothetical protein